jgi:NTE family protein
MSAEDASDVESAGAPARPERAASSNVSARREPAAERAVPRDGASPPSTDGAAARTTVPPTSAPPAARSARTPADSGASRRADGANASQQATGSALAGGDVTQGGSSGRSPATEHVRVGRDGVASRRGTGAGTDTVGGYAAWARPTGVLERAFVLAGGGATGIAWEAGIILGLRDGGVDVRDADTMIGTSAGSVVAAHLRLGTDEGNAFARIKQGADLATFGRLGAADAARYVRARVHLDPSEGRALVGRAALTAQTTSEEEWLAEIGLGLVGKDWPEGRLLITAVDAESGTSVVFDNASGVPLERAVAASCTVPGVFPAVEIAGRRYVDGGLRSIANIDLAAGHRRVVALAPYPIGTHLRDLPPVQLRTLRPKARTYLVVPDAKDLWAMGANPLDMRRGAGTFETARAHGLRIAARVAEVWGD